MIYGLPFHASDDDMVVDEPNAAPGILRLLVGALANTQKRLAGPDSEVAADQSTLS